MLIRVNSFIRKYSEEKTVGGGESKRKEATQDWDFKPSLRECSSGSIPQETSGDRVSHYPIRSNEDEYLLPHRSPCWFWALPAFLALWQSHLQQPESTLSRGKAQGGHAQVNGIDPDRLGRAMTMPVPIFVHLLVSTLTPVLGSTPSTFLANSF